jgi:hypothetical protein
MTEPEQDTQMTIDQDRGAAASPPQGDRIIISAFENMNATAAFLQELSRLQEVMALLEYALTHASQVDPRALFANEVGALSGLVRAYQGLQAAANLAVFGFYTEARAGIRGVYESAGLARMLAHDAELAEDWFRKAVWVPDRQSREFAAAMAGGDEDAKIPHRQYYKYASASAHPSAMTTLPYLLDSDGSINIKLYPRFHHEQFVGLANELTAEAIFVGYCLRNALSHPDALPPEWHKSLAQHAREFSGEPMKHLDDDWVERERQHEEIQQHVRPVEEINDFLRAHPNSIDNVRSRGYEADAGV